MLYSFHEASWRGMSSFSVHIRPSTTMKIDRTIHNQVLEDDRGTVAPFSVRIVYNSLPAIRSQVQHRRYCTIRSQTTQAILSSVTHATFLTQTTTPISYRETTIHAEPTFDVVACVSQGRCVFDANQVQQVLLSATKPIDARTLSPAAN